MVITHYKLIFSLIVELYVQKVINYNCLKWFLKFKSKVWHLKMYFPGIFKSAHVIFTPFWCLQRLCTSSKKYVHTPGWREKDTNNIQSAIDIVLACACIFCWRKKASHSQKNSDEISRNEALGDAFYYLRLGPIVEDLRHRFCCRAQSTKIKEQSSFLLSLRTYIKRKSERVSVQ